jgi:GNAT superfamily N-acetyltransferase
MHINLIRYQPTYDPGIASLEENSVQGNGIQLKILKEHFLDRSIVFSKIFPCLALNEKGEVIGTSVGAETKLVINGVIYTSGFVLDEKVHASYRNKGIGRQLAKEQKEWFRKEGWERNFTTVKLSNAAVVKLSAKAIGKIFLTPFVYLTIPTSTQISSGFKASGNKRFSVRLFGKASLPLKYHTTFQGGLGIFHTWMLYRVKVEKIAWLYRLGFRLMSKIFPKHYAVLPKEKEVMEFATLFNHTEENIGTINEVMEHLEGEGIKFLLVCCRKGDSIYEYLKKHSIHTYAYNMLTDFPLSENDTIALDVRCL